jgi:hypothetical protein
MEHNYIIGKGTYFKPFGSESRFSKILVTGLGRSGTSAVASILRHLGYFLGPKISNHENPELRGLLAKRDFDTINALLNKYLQEHSLFAWKDPKLYSKEAAEWIGTLGDDWLVIVIMRDPVAITLRRMYSDQVAFSDIFGTVIKNQEKLSLFVQSINKSVLLVSYEKLILKPANVIKELSSYCSIPLLEEEQIQAIEDLMAKDQGKYMDDAVPKARAKT